MARTGGLPPGPASRIPGWMAIAFARDRLGFLQDLASRYGDVVFFRLAGTPFALLNHPDYVRDVLVSRHRLFHKGLGLERARLLLGDGLLTSEDERHARQRRLIQPSMHRERITTYARVMVQYAERRSTGWRDGTRIDAAAEMAAITLAIAGKTLFDADIEGEATRIGDALTAALQSFNIALLPYGDRIVRLPIPPARRFRRARAALDDLVYRLIDERRASGARGADLLSMLIAARDEDGGGGMTDEQVRDEALTLLLAGHETTANALAWSWYLLARHPEVEARLHEEIDRTLSGRMPDPEDVRLLPYTRAVLAESMRLFPPAYLVGRRALTEYDVPGTPYVLPPRTVVFLVQHLLHRDPRFWDRPYDFLPERWLGRDASGVPAHRYAWFPFGAGPRVCIGEAFAWMEGVLVLATVARRWRLRRADARPIALQPIVTLRPRGGIPMMVVSRQS